MNSVPLPTGKQSFQVPLSALPANVLSQLREVPSNLSTARIFKLPPGVVLLKPTVGQILSPTNSVTHVSPQKVLKLQSSTLKTPEPPGSTQQTVATKVNKSQCVVVLKSPSGKILSGATSVTPGNPQQVLKWQSIKPVQDVLPKLTPKPSGHVQRNVTEVLNEDESCNDGLLNSAPSRATPPDNEREKVLTEKLSDKEYRILKAADNPASAESSKTAKGTGQNSKPTPWCREPRPLWKSKEPIVLYSGCKPENLEPKKKKEEPPKSLPCPQILDDMLPKSWKYHISSFEELQDPAKFKAELRTTINNKEDALQWVQDFEAISGTNFRVTKTFKENSFRIVFKKCFKCHKNSCKKDKVLKRESGRNLGCQARLSVTIKNSDMKQSTDLLLTQYPCVIGIIHNHCHPLTAEALRHRRPLPELKEKFSNMFRARITPSAARRLHLQDLKREYGDKYSEVILDGAKCPPLPWCYRLYYEIVGRKVKDGKKKSSRRSYYKKKTAILSRNPSQTVQAPAVVDFNSENIISNSYTASGLNDKRQCEEMQRSINSLYEYDFMSKSGVVRADEMVNGVAIGNGAENHSILSDNIQVDHVMHNSELLNSHCEASNDDFVDNTDMLDTAECVGEYVTSGEILNPDASASNEDVEMTDQGLNDFACQDSQPNEDLEMAKQNLNNVFSDLTTRLLQEPQKYLSAVNQFVSQYDERQTSSDADLLTALQEFGSQKSNSPNNVPSNVENSVSTIVEKYLVRKQTSAPCQKSEEASPKRKVLVLRMDPNKFNQIMGRVGKSLTKNVVNI